MAEAALAKVVPAHALATVGELPIEALTARVKKIRAVAKEVMTEGHHFGKIPGVDKPSLLKPGAELLCLTFMLAASFAHDERREGDHLEIVSTCTLTHMQTGMVVGAASGSCSTRESKYAYRRGERACPACGVVGPLTKSKQKPEWFCWTKKGGCGKTFAEKDPAVIGQVVGRVANPDLPDTYNTVRKMADKRALVATVLIVTCASDMFTQDVEEAAPAASEEPVDPQADPAPKVAPVASDEDVENVLAAIAECQSTEQLAAVSKANRNRKWNAEQKKRMKDAFDARTRELMNPDNDGREVEPVATEGDFRTMTDAIMRSPSLQYLETLWKQVKARKWTTEQLSALESAYDSRAADLTPPSADGVA